MQIERVTANLRLRNPWEAIDLGFAMARQRFWTLWLLWWLSALPVALSASLLLHQYPGYIGMAVWWFKPLFEPVLLFWLSRALFNEAPSFREARRHWWSVSKRRLLGNLTWRRLSPNRSFFMPIAQLEQPDSKAWRQRTGLFTRQYSGGAWLTVVGVHFEGVLMISLAFGIWMMVPSDLWPEWRLEEWLSDEVGVLAWANSLMSILVMSIIAPFYVAGGFGLYLARRTQLEAWDIELDFRRYISRLAAVLPLLLVFLLPLNSAPAEAADRADVELAIEEVLEDPDFGEEHSEMRWALKKDDDKQGLTVRSSVDFSGLAQVLEVLAWLAVAALVAWLIVQFNRYKDRLGPRQPRAGKIDMQPRRPVDLGIVQAHTLPADIVQAVRAALAQGQIREAVSLLYRGSLRELVQQHALEVESSATEGECLSQVRAQRPAEEAAFFTQLTQAWIQVAYAGKVPGLQQLDVLLAEWQRVFGDTQLVGQRP